ncbi:hypothetical protein RI367_002205 [Sorochytrium milnesiophthora]
MKLEEPERRTQLTKRFLELPDADHALVEHTVSQLKTWVRGICALPSSLAASLSSPSHSNRIESPTSAGAATEQTTNSGGSSVGPLSPAQASKQREIDYLVDAGVEKMLVRLLQMQPAPAFIKEYALGVIRDMLLASVRQDVADSWVRNEQLLDVLVALCSADVPSTIVSGVLDAGIALLGTTAVAMDEQYTAQIAQLLEWTSSVLCWTDKQVLRGLRDAPYQFDLLAIQENQAEGYAPRWNQILKDKAMLFVCTLLKSRHAAPVDGVNVPTQLVVRYACAHQLHPAYPETDVHTNAALCLHMLAHRQHTLPDDTAQCIAQGLRHLLQPQQSVDNIVHLFYDDDSATASSPLYPTHDATTKGRLYMAAQQAVVQRARQIAVLVDVLAHHAVAAKSSTLHFLDVFKDLRDLLESAATAQRQQSKSSAAVLADYLQTETFTKTVRVGRKTTTPAAVPTAVDSLLVCLIHLHRTQSPSVSVPDSLVRARLPVLTSLARQQFSSRQFTHAELSYRMCIQLAEYAAAPDMEQASVCALRSCRAECLLQLGQYDQAAQECIKGLALCSEDSAHYAKLQSRLHRAQQSCVPAVTQGAAGSTKTADQQ